MDARWLKLLFLSLAVIALLALLSSQSAEHRGRMNDAQWLSADQDSSMLYFRVDVDVLGALQYAILSVKARDEFEVWVNGKKVPSERIIGTLNASRLNLSRFLRPGNNVLGIKVASITRQQSAAVKAVIDYQDSKGRHFLVTSPKWSVTSLAKTALAADGQWANENRPDFNWAAAIILPDIGRGHWKQSGLPWVVQPSILQGDWFWAGDLYDDQLTLYREIDYKKGNELVLGVGVNGYYSLQVNGQVWVSGHATDNLIRLHNLEPMLRQGTNQITISVRTDAILPKMAIIGFQQNGEQIIDLSRPYDWSFKSMNSPLNIFDSLSTFTLELSYQESEYNLQYIFYFFIEWFTLFFSLVIIVAVILILSIKIYKNLFTQVLNANAALCFFMAFIWSLAFLLSKLNYFNFSFFQQYFLLLNAVILVAFNFNLRAIFARWGSSDV